MFLNQKVRFEGTPQLGPYWKLQLVAYKVNMEFKSKLSVLQRLSSLVGQKFSWPQQVGHEFEQRWAGNFRNAVRRRSVQIQCRWFCVPIKSRSKTTKTRFCHLIHKNYTYWGKKVDRCWTRKIFDLWLWSVEEIDPSSSSWKSTSRRWWSDWILENKRQSSDLFLELSSLVWW